MADITSVGVGTIQEATSGDLLLPMPAGIQADDYLVGLISYRGSGGTLSLPAGWRVIGTSSTGGGIASIQVFGKTSTGSETDVLATHGGTVGKVGVMTAFRNVNKAFQLVTVGAGGSSTLTTDPVPFPGVTTQYYDEAVIACGGYGEDTTDWGLPTGGPTFTEVFQIDSIAGNDESGYMAIAIKSTPGATGDLTSTVTAPIDARSTGFLFTLKPDWGGTTLTPEFDPTGVLG